MAGISTADDKTETLDFLRGRWRYSLSLFKTDPNAAAYVADFVAFEAEWKAMDAIEMAKEDAVTDADAAATAADAALDNLARLLVSAIFEGKKVDAKHPIAKIFFGGVSPSEFTRPRLDKQLENMGSWPELLANAQQPALIALVPAASVVPAAEKAAKALAGAIADQDLFRNGGQRKALFDHFNALCAAAYGGLKAFVHDHPELDLPPGYAESFFKQGPASSQPKTLNEANELVARIEKKLGKAKAAQAELAKKEAEHEAEVLAHEAALAAEEAAKAALSAAKKAKKDAEAAAKKAKPKKKK